MNTLAEIVETGSFVPARRFREDEDDFSVSLYPINCVQVKNGFDMLFVMAKGKDIRVNCHGDGELSYFGDFNLLQVSPTRKVVAEPISDEEMERGLMIMAACNDVDRRFGLGKEIDLGEVKRRKFPDLLHGDISDQDGFVRVFGENGFWYTVVATKKPIDFSTQYFQDFLQMHIDKGVAADSIIDMVRHYEDMGLKPYFIGARRNHPVNPIFLRDAQLDLIFHHEGFETREDCQEQVGLYEKLVESCGGVFQQLMKDSPAKYDEAMKMMFMLDGKEVPEIDTKLLFMPPESVRKLKMVGVNNVLEEKSHAGDFLEYAKLED